MFCKLCFKKPNGCRGTQCHLRIIYFEGIDCETKTREGSRNLKGLWQFKKTSFVLTFFPR